MGAGRLSFNPKVMISRHQSSESEPIKNSQKLNQKLKISKKTFQKSIKIKRIEVFKRLRQTSRAKKKGFGFRGLVAWNHPLIRSAKNRVLQKKSNYLTFYNHSHVLSEPIRKIFIPVFQGAGQNASGLATF